MTEHEMQASVIAECHLRANQDPRWGLLFAIPNGGKRSKATAGKLKAEGVKAGVPDLFLPVASARHHGLFIELKVQGRKRPREQSLWHVKLLDQGYAVYTIWDEPEHVIRIIENYLLGEI